MKQDLQRALEAEAVLQRRLMIGSLIFFALAVAASVVKIAVDGPGVLFDGHYVAAPYVRFR